MKCSPTNPYLQKKKLIQKIIVGTRSQICILSLRSYLITWICPRRRKRSDKPWNGGSHKEKGRRVQSKKVILLGQDECWLSEYLSNLADLL